MSSNQPVGPAQRLRRLQRAQRSKWNKYTYSGLIIVAIGLIMIFVGIGLRTGANSLEGLLIGFGGLVVLGGIIRALIGIITPTSPDELLPYEEQDLIAAERVDEIRREELQLHKEEQQLME